jgi:hypothetical protein
MGMFSKVNNRGRLILGKQLLFFFFLSSFSKQKSKQVSLFLMFIQCLSCKKKTTLKWYIITHKKSANAIKNMFSFAMKGWRRKWFPLSLSLCFALLVHLAYLQCLLHTLVNSRVILLAGAGRFVSFRWSADILLCLTWRNLQLLNLQLDALTESQHCFQAKRAFHCAFACFEWLSAPLYFALRHAVFRFVFLASVSATRNKPRKHKMQRIVSKRVFCLPSVIHFTRLFQLTRTSYTCRTSLHPRP